MERVSRRQLLAAGSGAALASAVIGSGVAAAQGTRPPGQPLTDWIERYVLVVDAPATASARPSTQQGVPTGPVYYTGSIYRDSDVSGGALSSSANAVGRFRVNGWVYGGGAVPQLVGVGSFDLAGRGKVTASGASGPVGSLGVAGGTGDFATATGEVRLAYLAPGNANQLIVEFDLIPQSVGR